MTLEEKIAKYPDIARVAYELVKRGIEDKGADIINAVFGSITGPSEPKDRPSINTVEGWNALARKLEQERQARAQSEATA